MLQPAVSWRIRVLVKSLTKKNYHKSLTEINQLLEMFNNNNVAVNNNNNNNSNSMADRSVFISTLLDELDPLLRDPQSVATKDESKISLLKEELVNCCLRSNCVNQICQSFESGLRQQSARVGNSLNDFIINLANLLNLSAAVKVSIAYSLSRSQYRLFVNDSFKILKATLPEVNAAACIAEMNEDVVRGLIQLVHGSEELSHVDVSQPFFNIFKQKVPVPISVNLTQNLAGSGGNRNSESGGDNMQRQSELSRNRANVGNLLYEVGTSASASAEVFRETLSSFGIKINEEQLANLIVVSMSPAPAKTTGDSETEEKKEHWNLEVIADVLRQDCEGFNWILVAKYLDNPNLVIRSEAEYQLLLRIFVRISGAAVPVAGLLGSSWNNKSAQLTILTLASNTPRNYVDFSSMVSQDQLIENIPTPPNLCWVCLPYYMRFFELANSGLRKEVLEILSKSAAVYPEYFLVSLSQVQEPTSGIRSDLLRRLLPSFTGLQGTRTSSGAVMRKLMTANPDLLIILFRIAFKKAKKLWEINNILVLLKMNQPLARRLEEDSSIDELFTYYCVKADRNELNLEEKIVGILQRNPKFAQIVITFIRTHADGLRLRSMTTGDGILTYENYSVLLRIVKEYPSIVPMEEIMALSNLAPQQLQQQMQKVPTIKEMSSTNLNSTNDLNVIEGFATDISELKNLQPNSDSEDIETVSNSYFQKVYTGKMSVMEMINLLKQFKSSVEKKDQEVFRCMIHNLFDEYRFFHNYPEKELQITGRLFGSLIMHQLVSSITLGIALRYVLEALRKDPDVGDGNGRIFRFGRIALEQFRSRLGEWPQYCSHLIQIPLLSRFWPDLFQEIQKSLANPNTQQNLSQVQQQQQLQQQQQQQQNTQQRFAQGPVTTPINGQGQNFQGNQFYLPGLQQQQQQQQNPIHLPASPQLEQMNANTSTSSLNLKFSNMNVSNATNSSNDALPDQGKANPQVSSVQQYPEQSLGLSSSISKTSLASVGKIVEGDGDTNSSGGISGQVQVPSDERERDRESDRSKMEILRMAKVNGDVFTNPPPDNVHNQIHFIINNIAKNNFAQKSEEIKEVLKDEYLNWFANYLVVKRISTQPNLHPLYLSIVDSLANQKLSNLILDSAYHNVTKLLQSKNITTSSSERSLLRNLGIWLGQMTLARNKPLLQRRINLKELLFWGYESGRLIAVCSFVARIVEGAKDSKVFRPPNPWLMALLGVMRELYEIEDLKLNIRFEVQVVCKNINIKIEDIPKGNSLSKCRPPIKDSQNPDFNIKDKGGSQGTVSSASPIVSNSPTVPQQLPPTINLPNLRNQDETKTDGASQITSNLSNLAQAIIINPSIQFFVANPNQRHLVLIAVERAIREIIQSVVDRSVFVALAATKTLLLKDFATEPNDQNLLNGSRLMMSSLAGSLAVATCKEPLRLSIGNHLRSLSSQIINDQTTIEQIVQVCSNDNVEVGILLIEKATIENSIQSVDVMVAEQIQMREKLKKEMGESFVDTENMPPSKYINEIHELMLPQIGGLSPQQLQVYEAFRRTKLKSLASTGSGVSSGTVQQSPSTTAQQGSVDGAKALPPTSQAASLNMSQALEAYQSLLVHIENSLKSVHMVAQGREVTLSMLGNDHQLSTLLKNLVIVTQRTQTAVRNETALIFTENIFNRMFESISQIDSLRLEVFVTILESIRDTCVQLSSNPGTGVNKPFDPDFISWLGNHAILVANDEQSRKTYKLILILLVRAKLIRPSDVDMYFVTHMENGRNLFWLELALSFIRTCLVEELGTVYDFTNTCEIVTKIRPPNVHLKKQLAKWLSEIKTVTANQEKQKAAQAQQQQQAVNNSPVLQGQNRSDQDQVREHVTLLLERWMRVWNCGNDQVFGQYLQLINQLGVFKTEEAADKFFRTSTEIGVEACLKTAVPNAGSPEGTTLNYIVIDTISKLFLLLGRLKDSRDSNDATMRIKMLSGVLQAVARTLIEDHVSKKAKNLPFDQRPYFRFFSNLSQDLNVPDGKQESNNPFLLSILNAYTQVYLAIQPTTLPGFAYAWVQLISRRNFMPHLLLVKGQKGWPHAHRLLSSLLLFLHPFLKASQLQERIKRLYKGTLRILLVLLHDFPEFLCDFHLSLCDLIPMNCVQLRNLVLSAFPRSMRLPDPFAPNLKVDVLAEISQPPRILTDYMAPLNSIRVHLDSYMQTKQPAELITNLHRVLTVYNGSYNVPLVTSLVVYVGVSAIGQSLNNVPIQNSPALDIYKQLVVSLDAKGRYILINAFANQLRFPNSHTHFFSFAILHLFLEAENEYIQEQITRVLLERLVAHRPHPWGLLITFIELIKNPKYSFWKKSFTRSAPEIERVFESVARSCIGQNAQAMIQQQLSH